MRDGLGVWGAPKAPTGSNRTSLKFHSFYVRPPILSASSAIQILPYGSIQLHAFGNRPFKGAYNKVDKTFTATAQADSDVLRYTTVHHLEYLLRNLSKPHCHGLNLVTFCDMIVACSNFSMSDSIVPTLWARHDSA